MKIGIFGGSFDPIHIAHLVIANFSADEFGLDKVFFVPASTSPFKKEYLFSSRDRLEMVRIATEDNKRFEVSDFEVAKGGISYTVETVEHFKKMFPDSSIFLILGQDSVKTLHLWKESEKIVESVEVIIYPRAVNGRVDSFEVPLPFEKYRNKFHFLCTPYLDISSTLIRERLKSGKSVRYLVPDKVLDYISRILKIS